MTRLEPGVRTAAPDPRGQRLAGLLAALGMCVPVLWAPGSATAATPECAAWPGEISPLPSTQSRDPFLARWARMRAEELTAVAGAVAAADPAAAHRLWRHALCLTPDSAATQRQLAQLAPRADNLAVPIVVREKPALEQRPRVDFAQADESMGNVSSALAEARFRDALDAVARTRTLLDALSATPEVLERRARLEVMAGTAELALGQEADAVLSLRRALEAAPDLALDDRTPPKVRRLFLSVRDSTNEANSR
jgi:hypothetical protein